MTQYARVEFKSAALAEDFGLQLAIRKIGCTEGELEAALGRFSRGKNKGKLRGFIHWLKVTEGGWLRQNGGCVVKPGSHDYQIRTGFDRLSGAVDMVRVVNDRLIRDAIAWIVATRPELAEKRRYSEEPRAYPVAVAMVQRGLDLQQALQEFDAGQEGKEEPSQANVDRLRAAFAMCSPAEICETPDAELADLIRQMDRGVLDIVCDAAAKPAKQDAA